VLIQLQFINIPVRTCFFIQNHLCFIYNMKCVCACIMRAVIVLIWLIAFSTVGYITWLMLLFLAVILSVYYVIIIYLVLAFGLFWTLELLYVSTSQTFFPWNPWSQKLLAAPQTNIKICRSKIGHRVVFYVSHECERQWILKYNLYIIKGNVSVSCITNSSNTLDVMVARYTCLVIVSWQFVVKTEFHTVMQW